MQSGQVNASQLLASFLGAENEKIGQSIAQSDFACELKKHIPASANSAVTAGVASGAPVAKAVNASATNPRLQAASAETQAAPRTKTSGSSMTRARKAATDTRTKIDSIKAKAKQETSLFISNPMADTILGDLQCPAEIRKACNGIQSQDGSISIKDLKSLVDTQPANGATDSAQVPAQHARALVESIVAKEGGTGQQGSASAGTLLSSIQIKTEGSYTPAEFKGLLDKVLKVAQTQQKQSTGSGTLSGSAEPATITEGLKTGQTQSLTATVLPSFISKDVSTKDFEIKNVSTKDFENVSAKTTLISQAKNASSEAQSVNAGDVRENSTDSVADNLKYDERLIAAKLSTQNRGLEGAALGMEAGTTGGSGQAGSTTGSAAASPAVVQEAAQTPIKGLDAILNNLNATITSAGAQQAELKSAVTPAPGTAYYGSVAQAQNLASTVKGAEKQADRPRGAVSSLKLPQDVAGQSDAAQIKTVSAEYPSSERSFDSDSNLAGTSQKTQAKAQDSTAGQEKIDGEKTFNETLVQTGEEAVSATESLSAKTDSKDMPVELRQTAQGDGTGGKKTPDETLVQTGEEAVTAGESLSAKSRDSIKGFEQRVDLSNSVKTADAVSQNGTQAIAAKTDSKDVAAEPKETSQGMEMAGKANTAVAGGNQAEAGGKAVGQQGFSGVPLRFDFPMEDFRSQDDASVSGEVSNSGISLHESASATSGMDVQKAAQTQTAISGQNTAIVSEHIDKQLGSRDRPWRTRLSRAQPRASRERIR